LANGDSILSPVGDIFDDSANVTIPTLLRFQSEKGKKMGRNMGKNCAVPTQQIGGKMKRKRTKRKQQGCDVAKVLDTVEQAVSTAKKVYRAVEPIVKTIVAQRRKTK